jgi:hypothetical protein
MQNVVPKIIPFRYLLLIYDASKKGERDIESFFKFFSKKEPISKFEKFIKNKIKIYR